MWSAGIFSIGLRLYSSASAPYCIFCFGPTLYFTQRVYDKKGAVIQNSSGLLYLSRPGKFRWVYMNPEPQEIVSDGKNVWIYDEDRLGKLLQAMVFGLECQHDVRLFLLIEHIRLIFVCLTLP